MRNLVACADLNLIAPLINAATALPTAHRARSQPVLDAEFFSSANPTTVIPTAPKNPPRNAQGITID